MPPNETLPDFDPSELVIDRRTGELRQSGADRAGEWIRSFRLAAEQSLFVFAKGVLGLNRLTTSLHKPCAAWLQRVPPYRKLLLMPRDHLKTSICARTLPIHIHIQPAERNIYAPGIDGSAMRTLLCGESQTNASQQLRWVATALEQNEIIRALWPHKVWDVARKQARKWTENEIILPRVKDYPEPSIQAAGIETRITGRHYDVFIKDDLTTWDAANSPTIMDTAIEWHKASRALMDDPDKSLEFILGTRWAVHDLYSYIQDKDPTVDCWTRAAIEEGRPIFPEMFSLQTLDRLSKELGPRFYLLFMNSASDPTLVDFNMELVRTYDVFGGTLHYDEDMRDASLKAAPPTFAASPQPWGRPLNKENYDLFVARDEYLRGRRP